MIATLNSCCPPSRNRMPYSTFKYPLSNKQPCMWTRSQYHVKSSRKRSFFCKLCACKQKHSSVVGRLTETDQIQIRDDTTNRACLRTFCYIGITTTVTTRIISDFKPTKQRMPYITFKYPMSNKHSCMWTRSQYHIESSQHVSKGSMQDISNGITDLWNLHHCYGWLYSLL